MLCGKIKNTALAMKSLTYAKFNAKINHVRGQVKRDISKAHWKRNYCYRAKSKDVDDKVLLNFISNNVIRIEKLLIVCSYVFPALEEEQDDSIILKILKHMLSVYISIRH